MTINNSLYHTEVVATLRLLQQERRIVSVLQRRSLSVLSVWAFTKTLVPFNACIPIVKSAWLVCTVHQSAVILCNALSVVPGHYCQVVEFRVSMINWLPTFSTVVHSGTYEWHMSPCQPWKRTHINRHSCCCGFFSFLEMVILGGQSYVCTISLYAL